MAISNVNSLQRSYKQKPPPGKTRNVERETGHVLRLEVLFCILTSFHLVLCIATLETSSFWTSSHPLASSTRSTTWRLVSLSLKAEFQTSKKKKAFLDCLGARRRHLGGDSSKVWNNLDAGDIPPYSRI